MSDIDKSNELEPDPDDKLPLDVEIKSEEAAQMLKELRETGPKKELPQRYQLIIFEFMIHNNYVYRAVYHSQKNFLFSRLMQRLRIPEREPKYKEYKAKIRDKIDNTSRLWQSKRAMTQDDTKKWPKFDPYVLDNWTKPAWDGKCTLGPYNEIYNKLQGFLPVLTSGQKKNLRELLSDGNGDEDEVRLTPCDS